MKPRALVVLNPAARHGTASARFEAVAPLLRRRFEIVVVATDPEGRWRGELEDAVRDGVPLVLAAGGDGTVGAVASALLACPNACGVALGAVGLGSSNDFHKPFATVAAGVPLRIDLAAARPRDVGRALFSRNGEPPVERAFLVSASLGVTARANALFNEKKGGPFSWLKRRFVDGAVFYAALATLVRHADVSGVIRLAGEEGTFSISNLSILKTPYLSGCLRFDTPVAPDSGLLAVNLCHGMGRGALVATLLALARGRFRGRAQTRHWLTRRVEVELAQAAPLELDGELVTARRVAFAVLPRRILTCA
jgi:diacylglycerol kinase (ATP)